MPWGMPETWPLPAVRSLMGDICPTRKTKCAAGSYVARYPKHVARSDMIPLKSSSLFRSNSEDQNEERLWNTRYEKLMRKPFLYPWNGTHAHSDAST
jgi:hypothetical protein